MVQTSMQKAQDMIQSIFNMGIDSPLEPLLTKAALMDINKWMVLSDEELKRLTYVDPATSTDMVIPLGDVIPLRIFRCHVHYIVTQRKNRLMTVQP